MGVFVAVFETLRFCLQAYFYDAVLAGEIRETDTVACGNRVAREAVSKGACSETDISRKSTAGFVRLAA